MLSLLGDSEFWRSGGRKILFALLAGATLLLNVPELRRVFRIHTSPISCANTPETAICRLLEEHVAQGEDIFFISSGDEREASVERSMMQAAAWVAMPAPVRCGTAMLNAECRMQDAEWESAQTIVAPYFDEDVNAAIAATGRFHKAGGVAGRRLWLAVSRGLPAASGRDGESADGRIKTELSPNPVHPVNPVKPPKQPPLLPISQPPRSESNSTHEVIGLLPLLAVCLAGGIAAGATGVFATVTLFSLLLFMLVLCGATSSITVWLAAALSVAAVYAAGRRKGAGGPYLSGYDIAVSLFVGAIVLGATGLIARAHPFVAPYGLAITGGRAKLWFLSGGIPSGFFTDAAWRLLEPAYPPGCAALTFGCYGASGICGDWLTQLAPCLFAAAAAVFLASRTTGLARLWLALLFLTPVALMMTGQFYPEPLMALGVLVGWLLIGAAGWFKNEGLFFLIAAWLAWRIIEGSRRASVRDLVCAMTLPLAWHAGCRIAGATLNDYLAPWRLSPMRGLRGLGESLGLVFLRPWDYGFAYPAAIVAALVPSVRRQSRPLVAALLFTAFSVAFFCLAYACSTADEAWHVSTSLPRLLWTPALILAREFAEVDRA